MKEIKLYLDGLDCAGCAGKIEDRTGKIDNVEESIMNFSSQMLTVKIADEQYEDDITSNVIDIVSKIEPDVVVKKQRNKEVHEECNSCSCGCCCEDNVEDKKSNINKKMIMITLGVILSVVSYFVVDNEAIKLLLFICSYAMVGGEVVIKAFKNILKGEVFDENFLMSIATIGAFIIKEYPEAIGVMVFYQVGTLLQGKAVNSSRRSIKNLMDIRPDHANVIRDNIEKKVRPDDVNIGEEIVVKPGERVPLDGILISNEGTIDTSALTGESMPRDVKCGDDILSGSINNNAVLKIKVTKKFGESTVSKILELVQNAGSKKANTEKFITKFARYYTPIVVLVALFLSTAMPFILNQDFSTWLYRGLSFLVVSCPCALVISIPLGFFGGIGAASRKGILVKGGNYLERLKDVDTVVFDKTGTITKGAFEVTEINPIKSSTLNKDHLLEYAAYAESYSNHPIALSIVSKYGKSIDKNKISSYEEISGHGTRIVYDDKTIIVGNKKLMDKFQISLDESSYDGTIVYVAVDDKYSGFIKISDRVKDDSKSAINAIKKLGIKKTVMLTGDNARSADIIAKEVGVDEVYSELLPADKVDKIEKIFEDNKGNGSIIFVGDGINDAPVLARADVGIAMGGIGSDAAIEAADIVIMNDELSKIAEAIKISRKTNRIVWENIILSLSIKVAVLILLAFGLGDMWGAVFADVGVTMLAVLNAMRLVNVKFRM